MSIKCDLRKAMITILGELEIPFHHIVVSSEKNIDHRIKISIRASSEYAHVIAKIFRIVTKSKCSYMHSSSYKNQSCQDISTYFNNEYELMESIEKLNLLKITRLS